MIDINSLLGPHLYLWVICIILVYMYHFIEDTKLRVMLAILILIFFCLGLSMVI